jgi:hypothetical protein
MIVYLPFDFINTTHPVKIVTKLNRFSLQIEIFIILFVEKAFTPQPIINNTTNDRQRKPEPFVHY